MEPTELLGLLFSIRWDSSNPRVISSNGFGWNIWPQEQKSCIRVHTGLICSFQCSLQSGAFQNCLWLIFLLIIQFWKHLSVIFVCITLRNHLISISFIEILEKRRQCTDRIFYLRIFAACFSHLISTFFYTLNILLKMSVLMSEW